MKIIVVDTNILFSFFWKNSFTKKILKSSYFELFSPELALKELEKYSDLIIKKINITKREFNNGLIELKSIINFVSQRKFNDFLKIAKEISIDKDDADFLALALKLKSPIWSNDKQLKEQNKVKILSTEDIIDLIFN